MTNMASVLHLSADHPDPIEAHKTAAIRSLIELTSGRFANRVISLNRKSPDWLRLLSAVLANPRRPRPEITRQPFASGEAWCYHAPGRGLLHRTLLTSLGSRLAEELRQTGIPELLVGHKLTVEGFAVAQVARELGIPYAITIQGDTDTKILQARPDLASPLRRIFHEAAVVVSFAPWSFAAIEARLGPRAGPSRIIPCPTELDQCVAPETAGGGLVSAFHLKNYRRKNLVGMAEALRLLDQGGHTVSLAIVGGGSAADQTAAALSGAKAPGLTFEGPLARDQMAQRLHRAAGFVMPSLRESFGLVFIEALFAGCPVIYPAGRAVDGYFDGCPFAIAVPPNDPQALAAAMLHVAGHERELKQSLAAWQQGPEARRFTRAAIGQDYAEALHLALRKAA